ncbi:hypothetical protein TTHT_1665 [Thermotomaculum hydrothermale]|uniref:PilZ domain-containing protein n=1 Tax=Thermotomaculum hydrothermale TaxID=981385 RepID=A0A7R6SYY0_9BACT|nr:PilZ domain-containing protein [Thermotomaculum hydrothermale]BBB33145.1 hypothetical protein TTHT_1665 [Thermotomaculum hydrothermale]
MEEKRKHKRVYFSLDEDYFVEIQGKSVLKPRLLSLSEGGLSFFLPLKKGDDFKKDDLIFLSSIKTKDKIIINSLVSLSVRYVRKDEEVNKAIVGCQFLDLPEEDRETIKKLVEEKIKEFPF